MGRSRWSCATQAARTRPSADGPPVVGRDRHGAPAGADGVPWPRLGARDVSRTLLVVLLVAVAVAKVMSWGTPTPRDSAVTSYLAPLVELALAVGLCTRHAIRVAGLVVVLAVGAGAYAWLGPSSGCGCLGGLLDDDWRIRMIVAGAGGLLAGVVVAGDAFRRDEE